MARLNPHDALADALGALGATLRHHRDLGVTELPLEGSYLLGPAESLRAQEKALQGCRRCRLCEGRTTIVFGSGNPRAEFVVIGEGPGADEDAQGLPFVGRAGQLLTRMLEARKVELSRDEVYITNAVKCFISPRVLIYTSDGFKPIKDIEIGDLVLTHRGRFRKVISVRPREVLPKGSPLMRLSIGPGDRQGRVVHVTVTPEHPFMVNGVWKRAAEIRAGDRLQTLGDVCEVCGRTYFVRYARYENRSYRTCSPRCHNKRVLHNEDTRERIRLAMKAQYASGRQDAQTHDFCVPADKLLIEVRGPSFNISAPMQEQALIKDRLAAQHGYAERILRNHRGEYVFVDAAVVAVKARRSLRDFRLYNIGVEEDESYVAAGLVSHNCRPPANRNPEADELAACAPFLAAQLAALAPKVILSLGSVATQSLLGTKEPIGKLRGRVHPYGSAVLIPTFHPAFLLRNPGDEYKRLAWEDLQLARREYDKRRTR